MLPLDSKKYFNCLEKLMKIIFLFGAFAIMFYTACKISWPDRFYPVYIDNKSNLIICSYLATGETGCTAYPDTSLSFDRKMIGYTTAPGETAEQELVEFPYEQWFSRLPKDTLSIFIFNKDTLNKYTWPEIQSGYKILQRYDLSLADFRLLSDNHGIPIITYPPNESMKHMKMYPPYKENVQP